MDANDIKIGTKLEIEIPELNKKKDQVQASYISQLIDVIDTTTISIVAPMSEGRLKFLLKDLKVVIYFLNSRQELLYFNGKVLGHRKNGLLDTFDISITSEFDKIQRRRFYRLEAVLECKYNFIDEHLVSTNKLNFQKPDESRLKTGVTKNISGSGFCLVQEESIDSGAVLDVIINLEDTASIQVFAQVIRSIHISSKKYEIGMNIIKISPRDADILTRFIFEKQRMMLKNTMQAKTK